MNRREIFLLVAICGLFISFASFSHASKKTFRFHVVITDKLNNDFSRLLLESLKKSLDGRVFVLTDESGVVLKDIAEREKMALSNDHSPHEMITKLVDPEPGDEKITMRFNRPNAEGLFNVDILQFSCQPDRTWRRVTNYGNFRFAKELSDQELHRRLSHFLVLLPFK